jgi:beta-N-acetylhexosaminidase
VLIRRRTVLVAVLVALAAGVWLAFLRGDSGGGDAASGRPPGVSEGAAKLASTLSPEELVDQVLLLGFEGTEAASPFVASLRERPIGGALVGPANWAGRAQGTALAKAIRAAGAAAEIPALVVANQEGGRYRAFPDLPPAATELEIAETGSVEATEKWARAVAEALRDAGFDLDLFPVADVATLDSPLADRAFSDDPGYVAELTAAALRGCRAAGLACAPAHFPGLGAASQDTSSGPATVSLDAAALSGRDLEPFRAATAENAPAVVLSLAFYAAYDAVTPGALTEAIATGLLRDRLGFKGVAITDDLGSGAVHAVYSVEDAAVEALAAGSDMIQIGSPEDQRGVREALLDAVASGALDEGRLEEAAARVLELKRELGLLELP